jgi:hypothetical protein
MEVAVQHWLRASFSALWEASAISPIRPPRAIDALNLRGQERGGCYKSLAPVVTGYWPDVWPDAGLATSNTWQGIAFHHGSNYAVDELAIEIAPRHELAGPLDRDLGQDGVECSRRVHSVVIPHFRPPGFTP